MQLIALNLWGGRIGDQPIKNFFLKNRDVEIFCLQEVWQTAGPVEDPKVDTTLLEKIQSYLPEHRFYFRPQFRGIYGPAIFVHRSLQIEEEGEVFVFKEQGYENPAAMGNHARNIQYVSVRTPDGLMTIVNFHGLWNGYGKSDTPDRILQSEKIADFIRGISHPFILAGDFNLNPGTHSMKLLNDVCSRNLIKDFGVKSTRSSLYQKQEKFADYILTGMGLEISDFAVLPDEVSDHLALRMSFEVI